MTEYDPNQFTTCPGCSTLREKRVMEDGLCPWCRLERLNVSPNPFIPLVNRIPDAKTAVCPEFKVPCQRRCTILCSAAIPQEHGKDWWMVTEWTVPYGEGEQVGVYRFNVDAAELAIVAVGVGPSSEPACICPENAVVNGCARHGYMYDSYLTNKDHLAEWNAAPNWFNTLATFQGIERWALKSLRAELNLRKIVAQTMIPSQSFAYEAVFHGQLDDTLLAFKRFEGPRPPMDPNYVPPKRTWRMRFRSWRHERNRNVQQWIHDHLTEAYCDH